MARITSGISFDMLGDGGSEATGWISGGEGFLAFDPNGTAITSASQMVASMAALASYDANGDGEISAADPAFQALRVWIPGSGGQGGSLESLAQLGIVSITVNGTAEDQFDRGNQILASFQFGNADGLDRLWRRCRFCARAEFLTIPHSHSLAAAARIRQPPHRQRQHRRHGRRQCHHNGRRRLGHRPRHTGKQRHNQPRGTATTALS